jgi:hypothetical protein
MAERTAEGIVRSGALQAGSPTGKKVKRYLAQIERVFMSSISALEPYFVSS